MNKEMQKPKGPWSHRFGIKFFTIILAILIYWLLGFLVHDIRNIRPPSYSKIERKYLDYKLVTKKNTLEDKLSDIRYEFEIKKRKQDIVGVSINNLEKTINQLLDLQRLSLEKNQQFSDTEQKAFAGSINHFLSNQKQYQDINEEIVLLSEEENKLNLDIKELETLIKQQKAPARSEYQKVLKKHRNKLAFYQLLILIPLLGISVILVIKHKNSIYFPIFIGFCVTILLKVSLVIHEYFPSKFFKYILILSLIGVVVRLLIYFIRSIANPKATALIKQFREAYERFLCPVCEYPIRRGPMKFLYWNRKTIKKQSISNSDKFEDSSYICPSCSTSLFEECSSCKKIRYSLLPSCEHCGANKEIKNF